jgi:hypothetical protein
VLHSVQILHERALVALADPHHQAHHLGQGRGELGGQPRPFRRAGGQLAAQLGVLGHQPDIKAGTEKRAWGTDDPVRKGGDYFGAAREPRS